MEHGADGNVRLKPFENEARINAPLELPRARLLSLLERKHRLTIVRAPLGLNRTHLIEVWFEKLAGQGALIGRAYAGLLPDHGGSARSAEEPSGMLTLTLAIEQLLHSLSHTMSWRADSVATDHMWPFDVMPEFQLLQEELGPRGVQLLRELCAMSHAHASHVFLNFDGFDNDDVAGPLFSSLFWFLLRAAPNVHIVVSTSLQTHAEVVLAPVVDSLIITHVDLLLLPQEIEDAFVSRGEKISDDFVQSAGQLAMRWPSLVQLFASYAGSADGGYFSVELGLPGAVNVVERMLRAECDVQGLALVLLAFHMRHLRVEDAVVFADEFRGDFELLSSALEDCCGGPRGLSDRWRSVTVKSAFAELISLGILEPADCGHATDEYALGALALSAAQRIADELPGPVNEQVSSCAAKIHIAGGALDRALESAVVTRSWPTLLRCVRENWWSILGTGFTLSKDLARRVPTWVSRSDARVWVLVAASLDLVGGGVTVNNGSHSDGPDLLQTLDGAGSATVQRRFATANDLAPEALGEAADVLSRYGLSLLLALDLRRSRIALEDALVLAPLSVEPLASSLRAKALLHTVAAFGGVDSDLGEVEDELTRLGESQDMMVARFSRIALARMSSMRLETCACSFSDFVHGFREGEEAIVTGLAALEMSAHLTCFMRRREQDEAIEHFYLVIENLPLGPHFQLIRYFVVNALAQLLMSVGRLSGARAALELIDSSQTPAFEGRARTLVLSGRYAEADRLCAQALSVSTAAHREVVALLLMRSLCQLRLGSESQARLAADRAVLLAVRRGDLCSFAQFPTEMMNSLGDLNGVVRELLASLPDWAHGLLEASTTVQELSPKELQVLQALSATRKIPMAARELYLGVNTVKTHLRSIYRKLEVHCVADAIERGTQLGLLEER